MRQPDLFRPHRSEPAGSCRAPRSRRPPAASRGWQGPTLAEFVSRVEGEFGGPPLTGSSRTGRRPAAPSLPGGAFRLASDCLGLDAWDRLDAASVRALCDQWGLPVEDFGLDA